uniref:BRCT domain-containing protein n=1 Tax=Arion vulgaris TaxID=1028688 RepID=A0A0B6ZHK2_9EUPU
MPKESLHDLLTACGAIVVDDPISLISKVARYKLIVYCSDSDAAPTTAELDMFRGLYKHMGLLTVIREWVLDSLGVYKLQPLLAYVLSTDASIQVPF